MGVLIEPNILEKKKEVIGRKPSFTNRVFSDKDDFDNGILITRVISGSDDLFFSTKDGSYNTYVGEGDFNNFSGSSNGSWDNLQDSHWKNDRKLGYGTT